MEKSDFGTVHILLMSFLLLSSGNVCQGATCTDGDTYGYTDDQEASITEENTDQNYLSGTLWYSSNYGKFDCCGLIKAIEVKVNVVGYIEFQVWKLTDPVSTTATMKANYRTLVQSNDGNPQVINIPTDSQLPIRDSDALGWIGELQDTVKWSTIPTLSPRPDSDYLWEDFSQWGYYNYTYIFAYHPASFSARNNEHTFANNGGQSRVFGVRAIVHPGHTSTFDELPLKIAIYTTSHVVGDVVHTVLYSGGTYLEMIMYVKLDAVISPDDGHLIWDGTTSQVKVGADLTSAVIGTPYTIKLTIYDGCHDNKTANLYVYVFDDRPQSPVCSSGQQIVIPPSFIWDQTAEEVIASGVALTDPRWRIPFNGKIESIEVCVASSPVDIEIQIWELVDLNFGQLKMLDYYVFTVADTGCPATKVTLPVRDQIAVSGNLVLGWREANSNPGIFMYKESRYLPATSNFLWTDLSGGIPYDYDVTGNPFQFEDAGFYNLKSLRDYGFRVYIGPGASPTITGLPANVHLKVGDYIRDDVIASFKYSDLNVRDILTWSFGLYPPTGEFTVNDTGSGSADVLVNVTTLDGLQGNTYLLTVEVTDGCTTSKDNLTIYVYVETTTTEPTTTTTEPTTTTTEPTTTTTEPTTTTTEPTTTTTEPTTTTTEPTTTTTEPTTTTTEPTTTTTEPTTTTTEPSTTAEVDSTESRLEISRVTRRSQDLANFWKSTPGYIVITVCTGLGLAIIGTITGLGRMCCKYFGAK
ncbi:hypothetical protein LSH36_130g00050 [Paralvinella palmiformis]|uniref:Uncharacterized protein n=1 Tax=Paralvinella palmiformis TaxID=53620 RepID=A0AAD9JWY3_9ANNE|nr:hypothetical protein LSH36_130g00050 [Paralvinella palmiformis]